MVRWTNNRCPSRIQARRAGLHGLANRRLGPARPATGWPGPEPVESRPEGASASGQNGGQGRFESRSNNGLSASNGGQITVMSASDCGQIRGKSASNRGQNGVKKAVAGPGTGFPVGVTAATIASATHLRAARVWTVRDSRYMVYGLWFSVYGLWSMVYGP